MKDGKLTCVQVAATEQAREIVEKLQKNGFTLFNSAPESENGMNVFQFYATTLEYIITDFVMGYPNPLEDMHDFFSELKQRVLQNIQLIYTTDQGCKNNKQKVKKTNTKKSL